MSWAREKLCLGDRDYIFIIAWLGVELWMLRNFRLLSSYSRKPAPKASRAIAAIAKIGRQTRQQIKQQIKQQFKISNNLVNLLTAIRKIIESHGHYHVFRKTHIFNLEI